MNNLSGNKMERWVHAQLHTIEVETGIDVDKVVEIIEMWNDVINAELISRKDADLFATLVEKEETATDGQFLKNLAQWIIDNTGNVNVAQRLNIITVGIESEGFL